MWSSFLGVCGGLVAAVTAHPLDTVKTRLQMGHSFRSSANPRVLLRGLMSPVLAVPPAWVANFAAYSEALRFTGDKTTAQHAAAGSLSGVVWALVVSPFELIKCIAQTEKRSSTEVWKDWWETRSFSLFRGLQITLLRDVLGLSVWFGVYHASKERGDSAFISGGLSGCSCWLSIYPIDLLKTRFQVEQSSTVAQSLKVLRQDISASGKLFWRPIPIILMRQFVAMGTSMTAVEQIRKGFG